MIDKEKFRVLNYIKKEEYTGSMEGMRYMLKRQGRDGSDRLEAVIWPEPFNYAKTPEEKKQRKDFELSNEGLEEAVDWLNEQHNINGFLHRSNSSDTNVI